MKQEWVQAWNQSQRLGRRNVHYASVSIKNDGIAEPFWSQDLSAQPVVFTGAEAIIHYIKVVNLYAR